MEVIAYVISHSNREGLNQVLWSLYYQTLTPSKVVVWNTGTALTSKQITNTIHLVSKLIPVEVVGARNHTIEGTVNLGHIRQDCHQYIASRHAGSLMWCLDDDLVFGHGLLETLYNAHYEYSEPVVPRISEDGRSCSKLEEISWTAEKVKCDAVRSRGPVHGLLAKASDVVKVNIMDYFIGGDVKIMTELEPIQVHLSEIIHSVPNTFRPRENYAFIEKIQTGEL